VMPTKLAASLTILADVARNPAFAADELERARKEAVDGLEEAYSDPGQLAAYATAPVVYAGTPFAHAADGTPASLKRLTRDDLARFHDRYWRPDNAILVLTGDITPGEGFALAAKAFGDWPKPADPPPPHAEGLATAAPRTVVIDLPGTGQAAVALTKPAIARSDPRFYQGLVANAVLGGGFSARLNEEVRVKRGLSYGADSSLTARRTLGAFTAEAQTKNDAAPQVADLLRQGMAGLATAPASADELTARKSSLIGDYGRSIATAAGLGGALNELALYGIDLSEIQHFTDEVQAVTPGQVQSFAQDVLKPDDASLIVVGDSKLFLDPLKAKAPNLEVISIMAFDPEGPSLKGPE
jgi:zinc protease